VFGATLTTIAIADITYVQHTPART
jgi:hypothetical protein